jgi:hypothetical protein
VFRSLGISHSRLSNFSSVAKDGDSESMNTRDFREFPSLDPSGSLLTLVLYKEAEGQLGG